MTRNMFIYVHFLLYIALLVKNAEQVDPRSICLSFYDCKNANPGYIDCFIQDIDCIENTYNQLKTDKNETTVFIHGYGGSKKSPSVQKLMEAYCLRDTSVIALVDWSHIAKGDVAIAANRIPEIAKIIASTYDTLNSKGYEISKWHNIGHSMGAHIAGCIATNTHFTFLHITGLDPGGNVFYTDVYQGDCLINPDTAHLTDIIYSDVTGYGTINKVGNVNIYLNTGTSQPGCCSSPDNHACSHFEAIYIYANATINRNQYEAVNCPDCFAYGYFNSCEGNERINVGPDVDPNARGNYCLRTDLTTPQPLDLL